MVATPNGPSQMTLLRLYIALHARVLLPAAALCPLQCKAMQCSWLLSYSSILMQRPMETQTQLSSVCPYNSKHLCTFRVAVI